MPAEPIEFRIVESLQAALKGINTNAGYHHTVASYAVKLDPDHEVEKLIGGANEPMGPPRPVIVLDLSPPATFAFDERNDRPTIVMPFVVHAFHDSDPKDDDSRLRTYLRLCADIETALRSNPSHGGLAMTTLPTARSMSEPDGQLVWAQVAGRVELKRFYGSPNG